MANLHFNVSPKAPYILLTLVWICLLALTLPIQAAQITVDDTDPDIIYSGPWSVGNECSRCWAQPDPAQAYGGTWHDAYHPDYTTATHGTRSFNYTFRGTGISIYGILAHWTPQQTNRSGSLFYFIDGVQVGTFRQNTVEDTAEISYQYGAPLAGISGLSDGVHTFSGDVAYRWTLLFDYLVYTTSDTASDGITRTTGIAPSQPPSSTPASSTSDLTSNSTVLPLPSISVNFSSIMSSVTDSRQPGTVIGVPVGNSSTNTSKRLDTGAIIGGTLGAASLLFIILLFLFWRKHQRRRQQLADLSTQSHQEVNTPTVYAIPLGGSSDSHRMDRDLKAPLPLADNPSQGIAPMRKDRTDLLPNNSIADAAPPSMPFEISKRQQMREAGRDELPAPWLRTRGPLPVDDLQRHGMTPPPPISPVHLRNQS